MIQDLSVLALIPARGGSKGVPGKNILPIAGRPLIRWTIDAALASRYVDRVVLSSDDDAIMQAAREGGCDVPFRRPPHLATDEASSIDVVVDALQRLPRYDVVVLLQPTSPLRAAQDIDAVLERLCDSGAPACVTVRPAEDHPYWVFRMDSRGGPLTPFVTHVADQASRRQDLPPAWSLNGAVYAARVDWFLRERRFLTPATVGHAMPFDRSLDIDTPADVDRFRRIVETATVTLNPI